MLLLIVCLFDLFLDYIICFFLFFLFIFLRDNMISLGIAEFRYYVVIIILVN